MVGPKFKIFLLAFRQGLIIILGAIEDLLEMQRSIIPKRKRKNSNYRVYGNVEINLTDGIMNEEKASDNNQVTEFQRPTE